MAGGGKVHHNGVPPPDGGWGWCVVLASFILQALTIGITYTFGVLFVALLDEFGESESTTSWIGSIQPCLLYFTGIIAGPLIQRFGWRAVTICGSIISAAGFFASSFAPNVYVMYLTYGGMTGIGNGLMYVTSMVAVQHWFDKKRAMATGLAVSGSGVGTLTFGYVTQLMLDSLGWRDTVRIQAAVILLGVLCGILFRPLPTNGSHPNVDDAEEHVTLTKGSHDDDDSDDEEDAPSGCCGFLGQIFDISLFKRPVFVIYCLVIIMFCFGYHVPYTYTPERAQQLGVPATDASFLVSIMGIANVCARLIFGWLGDKSQTVRFYLGGIVLTLGGVVSCLISFFTTYPTMVMYAALFGAFTGCWASLFPVILVDFMGIETIEQSLGQVLAAGSFAFLVASPMSGFIIQKTGSYDAPYQVVGALETAGGLFYFTLRCFKTRDQEEYEEIAPKRPMRKRYVSESFS